MIRDPLSREQVIGAIERRGDGSVPVVLHKWWGEGLAEKYGRPLFDLAEGIPEDICELWYTAPGADRSPNGNPEYRWGYRDYTEAERHSIGESAVLLPDWDELDRFLGHLPDPNEPGNFAPVAEKLAGPGGGRYRLGCWWRLYHEAFWGIRGMENLMLDYYDNMEGLKLLGGRLLEYYKVIVDRFRAAGCDGILTSDDLGHQRGPMMSPAIFHELYFPLYKQFIDHVHDRGMHVFLHSCGDNALLMEDLIGAGLDVFHPVQKGAMDMAETAGRFGGRISFLAGVDVQHLLPEAAPEEVREEIRRMKEIFRREGGGLLLAMGNGIMPDSPLKNIEAALTEMCR